MKKGEKKILGPLVQKGLLNGEIVYLQGFLNGLYGVADRLYPHLVAAVPFEKLRYEVKVIEEEHHLGTTVINFMIEGDWDVL